VEEGPNRDPLGVDRDRPIGHEPVTGNAQAEWGILHDEIAELSVDLLVDIHDAAIAQARRACLVQLAAKGRAHAREVVACGGQESLDTFLWPAPLLVR